jgi:hypothetical protein
VDSKEVGSVADDVDSAEVVFSGDDDKIGDGLLGVVAVGFGDDVSLGDAVGDEIAAADAAFGVDIAGFFSPERDEERCESLTIERQGVAKTVAEYWGWAAVVLGGSKNGNGVGGAGLIVAGVVADLEIDVGNPEDSSDEDSREGESEDALTEATAGGGFAVTALRRAWVGGHGCRARAMA